MHQNRAPMFIIILVESALECIPASSIERKKTKKMRQKRKKPLEKTLLDVSIHNHLMQNLVDKNKRGRPDIVHHSLLLALGSRLNKEGYLQIYVHTRNNEIIAFNPEVRVPRNYNRFKGLMEQLFDVGTIPPESDQPLIELKPQPLPDFISSLNPDIVVLFTEKGARLPQKDLQKHFLGKKKIVFLVGGFPHGEISQEIFELSKLYVSLYDDPLDTLVIVSYIIQISEQTIKLDE